MKKFLAILLTTTMVLSLAACGGGAASAASGDGAAPAASADAAASAAEAAASGDDVVTLKFTGWRVEDTNAINAMNEKFSAQYPNIKVVFEPQAATEYDTYLQTSLSNGTAADIIMMRSFSGGQTVYSSGKIATLTPENVPNLADFPDSALNAWADNGKSFAVPSGMTMEGVHYNKKIFADCGITKTPETVAEFLEDCQIIKDKGYLPIAGGVAEAWYVSEEITSSILMATIGSGDWVKKLYDKEIDFTDPAYVTMLQTLKDITPYYPDFYEGVGYEEAQQLFIAEQAAMYMSGSFELQYFTETNPDLELGCFAFPGQTAAPKAINFTAAVGVGAYADSPHLEEALTYLNWLASQEGGEAYANGVLGFFSPNPKVTKLESPIANEWNALSNGKETIHMLGYETMTAEAPDYSTAVADTVYKMCTENMSAEDAAKYMQDQMSWYFK